MACVGYCDSVGDKSKDSALERDTGGNGVPEESIRHRSPGVRSELAESSY